MLNDIVFKIIGIIDGGFRTVQVYANNLAFYLLVIDMALFGIYIAMGKSASIESIVEKILSIAFFLFLINNFKTLAQQFLNSIVHMTFSVSGSGDITFFTSPSAIMEFASTQILMPLGKIVDDTKAVSFGPVQIPDFKLVLIYGVAWICVTACFLIVALQIVIASIEFHIITLMGLVLIPFCLLEQTRFIGIKVFPAITGQAIKVGVASLIAGISVSVFRSMLLVPAVKDINIHFVVVLIGSSVLIAFLSLQIPALASSMLSGVPNMSLSGFVQNVSGAMSIGRAAYGAAQQHVGSRIASGANTARDIGTMAKSTLNKYFKG